MAQDDYYYEIQLTNKQLVFYFMAGATGLILSFLAGVMVGRGVDATGEVQAARAVEDRIVTEEPAPGPTQQPAAQDLTYSRRLESDRVDDTLKPVSPRERAPEAPSPAPVPAEASPAGRVASPRPANPPPLAKPVPSRAPTPKAVAAKPSAAATLPASAGSTGSVSGTFSIQVGAFKDRGSAESMVGRLKGKGYAAFFVSPAGGDGLFNVRVGTFEARTDAERIQDRLRDEEKFKPFIVKN